MEKYWRNNPVTMSIIGICVVAYLAQVVMPWVTNLGGFAVAYSYLQPWRFLTAGFLHTSIIHLAMNMLVLYVVGCPLEQTLGRGRYLVLYLLSIIGGSAALVLWAVVNVNAFGVLAIGASGAGYGLFAAVYIVQRNIGADLRPITGLLVINLIFSFMVPGIGWQAHLGGLFIGALVTSGFAASSRIAKRQFQTVYMREGLDVPRKTARSKERAVDVAVVIGTLAVILLMCLPTYLIYG